MIRDALSLIGEDFLKARAHAFGRNPVAEFVRHDAADEVKAALPQAFKTLNVRGSAGAGQWAHVPWIAVLDPTITDSATRGYYPVYLFSADMKRVYWSLNQGATEAHDEFGAGDLDELKRRAAVMRARIPEHRNRFSVISIDLAHTASLPRGYEAGHAFGSVYELSNIPDEHTLVADLAGMLRFYLILRSRGGVGGALDGEADTEGVSGLTFTERRRYRIHYAVERNGAAPQEAKRIHGSHCQGCGFDFDRTYGAFAHGYIEAHHLTPLAELPEDVPVSVDPRTDFAVLCANCHRMMHRKEGPKTIHDLQALEGLNALRVLFERQPTAGSD